VSSNGGHSAGSGRMCNLRPHARPPFRHRHQVSRRACQGRRIEGRVFSSTAVRAMSRSSRWSRESTGCAPTLCAPAEINAAMAVTSAVFESLKGFLLRSYRQIRGLSEETNPKSDAIGGGKRPASRRAEIPLLVHGSNPQMSARDDRAEPATRRHPNADRQINSARFCRSHQRMRTPGARGRITSDHGQR